MMSYSHFKSVVPRIRYPETVDDAQYKIDTAKPTLALTALVSPRKLAASFNSNVNRSSLLCFASNFSLFSTSLRFPDNRNINDLPYDVDSALVKPSVLKSVQASPRKFTVMTSKTPRSEMAKGLQIPPYNVKNKTLDHDLENTSIRYAIFNSKVERGLPLNPRHGISFSVSP